MPAASSQQPAALLDIHNLHVHFHTDDGVVRAVDGASFSIPRGKTVCVVGESGCGKSVTARAILQVVDAPGRIEQGEIWFRPNASTDLDIAALDSRGEAMRQLRGDEIGIIYQEPMSSLSPMYTIGNQIEEALRWHRDLSKAERREHTIDVLAKVGMPRPHELVDAYTFELSGGMRQRAMIAMALVCQPKLLIADEPTTALDVTTQANILDLMRELQAEMEMSMLFITHDLGVVAEIAHEVVVMYLGEVVEQGPVEQIFGDPQHPYTRALLRSIPKIHAGPRGDLAAIRGSVPHPLARPGGCLFHPRCDFAVAGVCDVVEPPSVGLADGRQVRCLAYSDSRVSLEEASVDAVAESPKGWVDERKLSGISGQNNLPVDNTRDPTPKPPPRARGGGFRDLVGNEPAPRGWGSPPLLDVRDLQMHFPIHSGLFNRVTGHVKAVDGVSFAIYEGETLGLVGESGCGKTTLGHSLMRLHRPTGGEVLYQNGEPEPVDLAALGERALKRFRREIRMIFQDPFGSLNPRLPVLDIVGEVLQVNGLAQGRALEERVAELLTQVGLSAEYMRRYPHAFSGGQRQRVGIARALAPNPRLVIADEPVSALDVSVQAQILNLLKQLQAELGLTYLFISHDLSVVAHISDRVAVMYVGKIVELAPTAELFAQPQHPYTEALLSAVLPPDPSARSRQRIRLEGDVADASNPPSGCAFHPRCRYAEARCQSEEPPLREVGDGRLVACHFAEKLDLAGVEK